MTIRKLHLVLLSLVSTCVIAQEQYENPVDGKVYESDKWVKHQPDGGVPDRGTEHIEIINMRLLSTEQQFEQNTDTNALIAFIESIKNAAITGLDHTTTPAEVMMKVTIHPDKSPTYDMVYRGEIQESDLQGLDDALEELLEFQSRKEALMFQIHFGINAREP